MANVKITDLTAYTDAASTDVLPIVDVSNNVTKKISISTLLKATPLGSAAAPAIAIDGDPNTGIYSLGADQLAISTGGTGRLFVSSAGLVGIGQSTTGLQAARSMAWQGSGEGTLYLSHSTADGNGDPFIKFGYNADEIGSLRQAGLTGVGLFSADYLNFGSSNTERMRLDSSGRLLVGTSSSRTVTNTPQILTESVQTGAGDRGITIVNGGAAASSGLINFAKHRSTSIGGTTAVSNGDFTGAVIFNGSDGTNFIQSAHILAQIDGTPGVNDMPGRLVFSTTADGASSPTERMRIDSAGLITAGSGGINGIQALLLNSGQINTSGGLFTLRTVTNNSGGYYQVFRNGADTVIGTISQSGTTAVAYNTTSDYRLKENVVPLTGAIDRLQQIPVHRFNFIADPDKTVDGFIAHEAQAMVPECVTGEKDAVDEQGNPVYQGIDQSKLVPLLTAALQEALQKIEDLEGRLTAAGL